MRAAVSSLGLPHEASPTADRVTVSVGVAEIDLGGGQGIRGWLADADARLYRAKHLGRDQVCAVLEAAADTD